ncbi:MAG: Ig-like domain-containing protein [Bacteroidota bacterium]
MKLLYVFLLLFCTVGLFAQDEVVITSPNDGDSFTVGTAITVVADVTIASGIDNVKLFVDGSTQSNTNGDNKVEVDGTTTTTDTYTFLPSEWQGLQGLSVGTHTIRVQAKRQGAATGEQDEITITITEGQVSGTTTITNAGELVIAKGLTELRGENVGDIVGFTYNNGWQQIPVQIDERDSIPINKPYNGYLSPNSSTVCDGQTTPELASQWIIETYCDPLTHVGEDSDPLFDFNDEINFYFDRLSDQEGDGTLPAGVDVLLAKLEVVIPSDADTRYLYLYRSTTLAPDAGESPAVTNDFNFKADQNDPSFNLAMSDYKANYRICNYGNGDNLENTTITAPNYTIHFSSRVRQDDLQIETGNGKGLDIMTVVQATNQNNRAISTYETGPGAIVYNFEGVNCTRRGVMGASSGRYTEYGRLYTKGYTEERAYKRVHGGNNAELFGYKHLNSNVNGAQYAASNLMTPRTITGNFGEERGRAGVVQSYDFLASSQGNLITIYDQELANGASVSNFSYFLDDASRVIPPSSALFPNDNTGYYGTYGTGERSSDCTDHTYPNNATCAQYTAKTVPIITGITRTYYEPVSTTQSDAQQRRIYYDTPTTIQSVDATADGLSNEIRISTPPDGASYDSGVSIDVAVVAQDDDGVASVELFVNAVSNGSFTTGSNPTAYSTTFFAPQDLSNMSAGTYTIEARYTDALNNTGSDIHTITVVSNQPPTQTVNGVGNGQVFPLGSNINITVNPSDVDGTIQKVDLFVDNQLFGTDVSAPYQFFVTGLSSGPHSIRAVTTDDDGAETTNTFNINVGDLQGTESRVTNSLIDRNAPLYAGKGGWAWTVSEDETTTILQEPNNTLNGVYSSGNNNLDWAISDYGLNNDLNGRLRDNTYRLFDDTGDINRELRFSSNQFSLSLSNSEGDRFDILSSAILGQVNGEIKITNDGSESSLGLFGGRTRISGSNGTDTPFFELDANSFTGMRFFTKTPIASDMVMTANDVQGNAQFASPVANMSFNFVDVDATTRRLDVTAAGVTVSSTLLNVAGTNNGQADNWGTQVAATDNSITGDGTGGSPLSVNEPSLSIDWTQITNVPTDIADGDRFLAGKATNLSAGQYTYSLQNEAGGLMTNITLQEGNNFSFGNAGGVAVLNAVDDQRLSFNGTTNILSISGDVGNSVDLSALDNNNDVDLLWEENGTALNPISADRVHIGNNGFGGNATLSLSSTFPSWTASTSENIITIAANPSADNQGGRIGIGIGDGVADAGIYAVSESSFSQDIGLGLAVHNGIQQTERLRLNSVGRLVLSAYGSSSIYFEPEIQAGQRIGVYNSSGVLGLTSLSGLISDDANNGVTIGTDGRLYATVGGMGDGNNFVNDGTFNTSNGNLNLTGTGAAGATINLDGRYLQTETDVSDVTFDATSGELSVTESGNVESDVIYSREAGQLLNIGNDGGMLLDQVQSDDANNDIVAGSDGLAYYNDGEYMAVQLQYKYENTNAISDGTSSVFPAIVPNKGTGPTAYRINGVRFFIEKDFNAVCDIELISGGSVIFTERSEVGNTAFGSAESISVNNVLPIYIRVSNISGGNVFNVFASLRIVEN